VLLKLWIRVRCCIYIITVGTFSFICVNNFKRWIKLLLQNPVYGPKAAVGISTRIEPVTVELAIYVRRV
jgi:hypothetical protein